nr:PIN domain-containing protein [uncultured Duganella sp.]
MNGILVDTSVWISHFRNRDAALETLLSQDLVRTHPMVIGEIACGTPPAPRSRTLRNLGLLSTTQHASMRETMDFIERESLYGLGCGLVDLVLLASTLLTPSTKLWTRDQRLAKLAARFSVAHQFP